MGDWEGEVVEITWRAVKVRTRQGNQVIIPNSELSKSALVNYSEPAAPTRVHIDIGTSYDDPPNRVKAAILEVLDHESLVLKAPAPMVHLMEFAGSSINYRAHFWIERYPMEEIVRDRVRSALYYMLKRRGISIPYPIQVEYSAELPPPGPDAAAQRRAAALAGGNRSVRAARRGRAGTAGDRSRRFSASAPEKRSSARATRAGRRTSCAAVACA